MSSQRWFISVLPMDIIQRAVEIALLYRYTMSNFDETLVEKASIPNSTMVFPTLEATEHNRPDIIVLLNSLFEAPECVNIWVFSKPNKDIICAWRGFEMSPNTPLSSSSLANEIMVYIHRRDIMLDAITCYWCETHSLSATLSLCTKCCKSLLLLQEMPNLRLEKLSQGRM